MILFQEPLIVAASLAVVAAGALTDCFTRRIPNLLTIGGLGFGLSSHAALGFVDGGSHGAIRGLLLSLAGALLCALLPFISFVRGEIGGGDVKLFAAMGAMVGPSLGLDAQLSTFLFALFVLYPWVAIRNGSLRAGFERLRAKLRGEPVAPRAAIKLPRIILGPAILLGLCVAVLRHGVLAT